MNRYIITIFLIFTGLAPAAFIEASASVFKYIAPESSLEGVEYEEEATPRYPQFNTEGNLFTYEIAHVSNNGAEIQLEDGSLWKVGIFTMLTTMNWRPGERISIWVDFNSWSRCFKLYNLNRKQEAWSDCDSYPDPGSLKLITVMAIEKGGSRLVLTNGTVFESRDFAFKSGCFYVDDAVMVLSNSTPFGFEYGIWNISSRWVVKNVQPVF